MAIFRADISIENCFNADMFIEDNLSGELGTFHAVSAVEHPYHGEYEVTPTEETQTLLTEGKTLSYNVIVNPIPSNYGRITWDGSTLTVS